MRVSNETNWRTDQLKKLAMEVAYNELSLTTEGRKNLKIKFHHKGTVAFRGTPEWPGGIRIKLDKDSVLKQSLAQKIAWGIGVAVGLRARDLKGLTKYSWLPKDYMPCYQWANKFPIALKPPKPEESEEVTAEKKQTTERAGRMSDVTWAMGRVERWERILNNAMTKLMAWKKELKRAERKLAEVQTTVILESVGKPTYGRKFRKPESEIAEA